MVFMDVNYWYAVSHDDRLGCTANASLLAVVMGNTLPLYHRVYISVY